MVMAAIPGITPPLYSSPRRRRWWIYILVVLVAALSFIGYGFYLVATQGPGPSVVGQPRFTNSGNSQTVSIVDKTRLIRHTSPSLGSASAKVTIVEFADFECPYSKESYSIIRTIAAEYGDRIQVVFRNYPVPSLHEHAQAAAEAAVCAGQQGKFWPYHDRLFQNQDHLDTASLRAYAVSGGLAMNDFDRCLASGEGKKQVEEDIADGWSVGVRGTPTWFFNGVKVEGSRSIEDFRAVINALLADAV